MKVQITAEITTFVTMTIDVPSSSLGTMHSAMCDSINTYGIDDNDAVIESDIVDKSIKSHVIID